MEVTSGGMDAAAHWGALRGAEGAGAALMVNEYARAFRSVVFVLGVRGRVVRRPPLDVPGVVYRR